MDIVDALLEYKKIHNPKILVKECEYNIVDLNVMVTEILSWLKLERKREIWIEQGKKIKLRNMSVNLNYPWCLDLIRYTNEDTIFAQYFAISEGTLEFKNEISEEQKKALREKAYKNYNPQMIIN